MSEPWVMSDLYQLSCDVTNMRHAVLGLDFWGYLCYNSIIQKNKEADSLSLANKIEQMFYMSLANKRVRELVSLNEPTK